MILEIYMYVNLDQNGQNITSFVVFSILYFLSDFDLDGLLVVCLTVFSYLLGNIVLY